MTQGLSSNAKAILLLTAPLIAGRGEVTSDLLTPGEYKRLARFLREIQRQPADLISNESEQVIRACQPVIDESRLKRLSDRGFLLGQATERWQARAIWVVSRADPDYPRSLKARLREDAPAILYGCGDKGLLETGGLAVVGSRHVDADLIDYTESIGRLAARARKTLVSGGAKGIDQAAMRGAIEVGGKVCGVLADSLERTVMNREHRNLLLDGQLVLISPYDPNAGFNVGNAMQRNKLIYALADLALIVSSDLNKGGTWAGAIEQLGKYKSDRVYVRSTGATSAGLDALRKKGAHLWPNPQDEAALAEIIDTKMSRATVPIQAGLPLFLNDEEQDEETPPAVPPLPNVLIAKQLESSASRQPRTDELATSGHVEEAAIPASSPATMLFTAVRTSIQQLLRTPKKDAEIAEELGVTSAQAKIWLKRLVDEGMVEKRNRPAGYVIKQRDMF